jgi:hypothetical protein
MLQKGLFFFSKFFPQIIGKLALKSKSLFVGFQMKVAVKYESIFSDWAAAVHCVLHFVLYVNVVPLCIHSESHI